MNEMYDVLAAELERVGDCLFSYRLFLNIEKTSNMSVLNKNIAEKELTYGV